MEAIWKAAFDIICQEANLAHLDILIAFDMGTHDTGSPYPGGKGEGCDNSAVSHAHRWSVVIPRLSSNNHYICTTSSRALQSSIMIDVNSLKELLSGIESSLFFIP